MCKACVLLLPVRPLTPCLLTASFNGPQGSCARSCSVACASAVVHMTLPQLPLTCIRLPQAPPDLDDLDDDMVEDLVSTYNFGGGGEAADGEGGAGSSHKTRKQVCWL